MSRDKPNVPRVDIRLAMSTTMVLKFKVTVNDEKNNLIAVKWTKGKDGNLTYLPTYSAPGGPYQDTDLRRTV